MFEASIEFLNGKQVDLIPSYLIATPERLAVMDFTYPVAMTDHVIVQPMPKIHKDLLSASVNPLQSTVNKNNL
jgi:ABC-type amino acid transport substrate-binding protein